MSSDREEEVSDVDANKISNRLMCLHILLLHLFIQMDRQVKVDNIYALLARREKIEIKVSITFQLCLHFNNDKRK